MKKERFRLLVEHYLRLITIAENAAKANEKEHLRKIVDIFKYRCGDDIKALLEKERVRYNRVPYEWEGSSYVLQSTWGTPSYDRHIAAERRAREIYYQHESGYFESEGEA